MFGHSASRSILAVSANGHFLAGMTFLWQLRFSGFQTLDDDHSCTGTRVANGAGFRILG